MVIATEQARNGPFLLALVPRLGWKPSLKPSDPNLGAKTMRSRAKVAVIARQDAADEILYRFAGLVVVSLFPALFWTAVIATTSAAMGYGLSAQALTAVGTAIAAFCAAVGWTLIGRADA
jgi:hypothetical protein